MSGRIETIQETLEFVRDIPTPDIEYENRRSDRADAALAALDAIKVELADQSDLEHQFERRAYWRERAERAEAELAHKDAAIENVRWSADCGPISRVLLARALAEPTGETE